ncbi:MAG: hypothetical protein GF393_01155, partial [Armatimonadia bacterium]|nr:hypothetical protein [Armatimonadia bacterium]
MATGLISCLVWAAPGPAELGETVGFRLLVDKVMHRAADATSAQWVVEETAAAGFNVYSPRLGYKDYEMVRDVTDWCAEADIYHMVWMRGTLRAPEDELSEGKRCVWANGHQEWLWSPNSDEFWDWTTAHIIEYARISAERPNLIGVILDYENYAPGEGTGFLYPYSYDDIILGKFAQAQQIDLPELALDERAPWLDEQGLHEQFRQFQLAHWRERCRALRDAVDAHNPDFRFVVYPGPGQPFTGQAAGVEWSTKRAPVVFATPRTYGRITKFAPQSATIEANGGVLSALVAEAEALGVPFHYLGGIDPVVQGADPEFCGRNAVILAQNGDGYWVFYEGPTYEEDHPAYFEWFTRANAAIDEENWEFALQPRETPVSWDLDPAVVAEGLVPPEWTGERVTFPSTFFRGDYLVVVNARAGETVTLELQLNPLGRKWAKLFYVVHGPDGVRLAGDSIADRHSQVSFTPTQDGLHLMGLSAGDWGGAWRVVAANAPLGVQWP